MDDSILKQALGKLTGIKPNCIYKPKSAYIDTDRLDRITLYVMVNNVFCEGMPINPTWSGTVITAREAHEFNQIMNLGV